MMALRSVPEDVVLAGLQIPQPLQTITPEEACELAVIIGLHGSGYVSPNPLVGAVVVDEQHRFVAIGAHERVGGDHAEAVALRRALDQGYQPKDLHVYVTLEPCSFAGRTPSCAQLLAEQRVAQVSYALIDPNPRVAGQGIAILQEAGVKTSAWPEAFAAEAARLAEVFLHNQTKQQIFVAAKMATDAQGVYALAGDRRAFLTGVRSRAYGHYLRQRYDAVAVGADTLILDDPLLSPRDVMFTPRLPWRVVLDGSGRALAEVLCSLQQGKTPAIFAEEGARVIWVMRDASQSVAEGLAYLKSHQVPCLMVRDEGELLARLWEFDIRCLLLEGGGGVWQSFWAAGLVHKAYHFRAPQVLTGTQPQSVQPMLEAIAAQGQIVRQYELEGDQFFEITLPAAPSC